MWQDFTSVFKLLMQKVELRYYKICTVECELKWKSVNLYINLSSEIVKLLSTCDQICNITFREGKINVRSFCPAPSQFRIVHQGIFLCALAQWLFNCPFLFCGKMTYLSWATACLSTSILYCLVLKIFHPAAGQKDELYWFMLSWAVSINDVSIFSNCTRRLWYWTLGIISYH